MTYNLEQFNEILAVEENITRASKKYAEKNNIPYTDSLRRRFSALVAKSESGTIDSDLENDTSTETNQYSNDKGKPDRGFTAIDSDGTLMSIERYCEVHGLDKGKIRSYKLISHTNVPFYNVCFFSVEDEAILDVESHLDEIISKYIKPEILPLIEPINSAEDWFDRLVYTDTHINMNVNGKEGAPLYEGKWDKEEILRRLDEMINHTLEYKKGKSLIINDLGDFMDGMGGYTTRGGHQLPQMTTDKEAFELAVLFKLKLVDSLVPHYQRVICRDTVNDNHSGLFSSIVSSTVGKILNERYGDRVEYHTLEKFIEHYTIGKHTFLESHGKDTVENKFNAFKVILDSKQSEKIDQYCKEHKLYNGNYIEFSKGNDHQAIYDDTTSNDFSYYSYLAFSPPSNYIKTNFKQTRSGFRLYNIHKEKNIKITIPYFF